jgi:hypothetical protein
MEWTTPHSTVRGFCGAEAVLVTDGYLLARWNHAQCRGWLLYTAVVSHRREYTHVRWIASAGVESLDWSDGQAIRWAEGLIAAQGQ